MSVGLMSHVGFKETARAFILLNLRLKGLILPGEGALGEADPGHDPPFCGPPNYVHTSILRSISIIIIISYPSSLPKNLTLLSKVKATVKKQSGQNRN